MKGPRRFPPPWSVEEQEASSSATRTGRRSRKTAKATSSATKLTRARERCVAEACYLGAIGRFVRYS